MQKPSKLSATPPSFVPRCLFKLWALSLSLLTSRLIQTISKMLQRVNQQMTLESLRLKGVFCWGGVVFVHSCAPPEGVT